MSIILSRDLVLSAPASVPLNTPLIGWRNIVTATTLAVSSEDPDFPGVNLTNPSTVEKWKGSGTVTQTITISPANTDGIDYVAIARHNIGTLQVPITLAGRRAVSDPYVTIREVIPPNDNPILFRFTEQSFSQVQLSIAAASAVPQIAVLFVGKLLVFERGVRPSHMPLRFGRAVNVVNGRSENGEFLGSIITGRHRKSAADIANLSPDWARAELEPFLEHAEGSPFFYAWHHDTYPSEVGYCWLTNQPEPAINDLDHTMQVLLQLEGIA